MKNKFLYIAFGVVLQIAGVDAMDGCCDHKGLESTARRYALSISNAEKIDTKGILNDLQFLSPEAVRSSVFSKYTLDDSFEAITRQAVTADQKHAVEIFSREFDSIKTNSLLRAQFCMLLDRIIINLRPSIPINIRTHPALQGLAKNPFFSSQKMLLPLLISGPIDD